MNVAFSDEVLNLGNIPYWFHYVIGDLCFS